MRRTVEVARGQVPDGFLEGVLGMRAGDMRKVRFRVEQAQAAAGIFAGGPAPEDGASTKDGSGQAPATDDYVADVTLWEVQQKAVPVIDDAWVGRNLPQFGTVEGFRQFVRADLEAQKERVERQQLVSRARSALEKDVAAAKRQLSGDLAHLSDEEFRERGFRRSLGEHIRREKALKWLMDTMAID